VGAGTATLTVSLKWDRVPVASTTHTLRVLESSAKTLPVSSRLIRSLAHPERTANLWGVRFGDDGRLFGFGYPSGVVQIWDPKTGKELRHVDSPRGYRGSGDYALTTDALKTLYVPIDGRKATDLADTKKRFRIDYNGHLLVWDLASGKAKEPIPAAKNHGVVTAFLSPDGARLISVEREGYFANEEGKEDIVRLIDTATGKGRKICEGYAMPAFSADGKRLYLALMDRHDMGGSIKVFDAQGNEELELDTIKGQLFSRPVLSPDGKHLAVRVTKGVINKPGAIRLYDLATNKQVAEFPSGGNFPFLAAEFSPDGRLLVCGDYNEGLHFWDVAGRKLLRKRTFKGMGFGLRLAFSKDGTKLAVPMRVKADNERDRDPDPLDLPQPRVYLFDLKAGGEPEEIVCPHGWAGGVAFSADGNVLAVGGAGAVHLFDVAKK
jgi:WD40 repeat protein